MSNIEAPLSREDWKDESNVKFHTLDTKAAAWHAAEAKSEQDSKRTAFQEHYWVEFERYRTVRGSLLASEITPERYQCQRVTYEPTMEVQYDPWDSTNQQPETGKGIIRTAVVWFDPRWNKDENTHVNIAFFLISALYEASKKDLETYQYAHKLCLEADYTRDPKGKGASQIESCGGFKEFILNKRTHSNVDLYNLPDEYPWTVPIGTYHVDELGEENYFFNRNLFTHVEKCEPTTSKATVDSVYKGKTTAEDREKEALKLYNKCDPQRYNEEYQSKYDVDDPANTASAAQKAADDYAAKNPGWFGDFADHYRHLDYRDLVEDAHIEENHIWEFASVSWHFGCADRFKTGVDDWPLESTEVAECVKDLPLNVDKWKYFSIDSEEITSDDPNVSLHGEDFSQIIFILKDHVRNYQNHWTEDVIADDALTSGTAQVTEYTGNGVWTNPAGRLFSDDANAWSRTYPPQGQRCGTASGELNGSVDIKKHIKKNGVGLPHPGKTNKTTLYTSPLFGPVVVETPKQALMRESKEQFERLKDKNAKIRAMEPLHWSKSYFNIGKHELALLYLEARCRSRRGLDALHRLSELKRAGEAVSKGKSWKEMKEMSEEYGHAAEYKKYCNGKWAAEALEWLTEEGIIYNDAHARNRHEEPLLIGTKLKIVWKYGKEGAYPVMVKNLFKGTSEYFNAGKNNSDLNQHQKGHWMMLGKLVGFEVDDKDMDEREAALSVGRVYWRMGEDPPANTKSFWLPDGKGGVNNVWLSMCNTKSQEQERALKERRPPYFLAQDLPADSALQNDEEHPRETHADKNSLFKLARLTVLDKNEKGEFVPKESLDFKDSGNYYPSLFPPSGAIAGEGNPTIKSAPTIPSVAPAPAPAAAAAESGSDYSDYGYSDYGYSGDDYSDDYYSDDYSY